MDIKLPKLELLTEKKWSAAVETHWHPEEGFFTKSATAIASGLKSKSDSLQQAMSRLDFYINRAGKNLSASEKAKLETAKDKLRALY
jgi:tRNA(adenine34) deaminase